MQTKYFVIKNGNGDFEIEELKSLNEEEAVREASAASLKNGTKACFVADTDGLLEIKGLIEEVLLQAGHVNFR